MDPFVYTNLELLIKYSPRHLVISRIDSLYRQRHQKYNSEIFRSVTLLRPMITLLMDFQKFQLLVAVGLACPLLKIEMKLWTNRK